MSQRVTLVNGSGQELGTTADPVNVEGSISFSPSGTQDVNQTQVNGIAVATGVGATSTGTQRVTTSTDSTIGTVTAVTTVTNLSQQGGVAISLNTGVRDTGTQRVTIATNDLVPVAGSGTAGSAAGGILTIQGVASMTKLLVTPDANSAINIAQVAGGTAITSGVTGSQAMGGDTASAATDAGFPMKIGGVGKTANPTAVTDGQRVNAIFDKVGKQIVVGAIRDLKGVTQTQISNSTSETTIVAAVASTFLDVYGLVFANTGATTTKVTVKDATSGTTRMIFEVPTLETRGFMVPVDSAVPQAVVNNNWTATCTSATTAMEVTALWVKNL